MDERNPLGSIVSKNPEDALASVLVEEPLWWTTKLSRRISLTYTPTAWDFGFGWTKGEIVEVGCATIELEAEVHFCFGPFTLEIQTEETHDELQS